MQKGFIKIQIFVPFRLLVSEIEVTISGPI